MTRVASPLVPPHLTRPLLLTRAGLARSSAPGARAEICNFASIGNTEEQISFRVTEFNWHLLTNDHEQLWLAH